MELNLSGVPDDGIHVSGFGGEDEGVVQLDAVPQVDTVLHGCLGPDVLDGYVASAPSAWLSNVDLTALTGDAVYYRRLQSQVVLDRPKETRCFPGREAHRLDVVPSQHPADAVEYRPDIRQESDKILLFVGLGNIRRGGGLRALRICRSV
jgi:hypothetical protein